MDLSLPTITGGADAVLNELRRSPLGTVNFADPDSVTGRCVYIMRERAIRYCAALLTPALNSVLQMYTALNGARPEQPPQDGAQEDWQRGDYEQRDAEIQDWDAGLDDAVEAELLKAVDYVSQSFLGVYGSDTMLHEEFKAVERIANAFGKDVWTCHTYKFENLSDMVEAIGVYPKSIKPEQIVPPTKEEVKADMDNTMRRLHAALEARGTFDPAAMAAELEMASDSDDILAMGAIMRLGGDFAEDVQNLRMHRAMYGKDDFRNLALAIEAYEEPTAPVSDAALAAVAQTFSGGPPAATPASPAPEKPKKPRRTPDRPQGAVSGAALAIVRKFTGLRDQELADKIGVSRSTWNNYEKDKAWLVPTGEQKEYLVQLVQTALDQLNWAKETLSA